MKKLADFLAWPFAKPLRGALVLAFLAVWPRAIYALNDAISAARGLQ